MLSIHVVTIMFTGRPVGTRAKYTPRRMFRHATDDRHSPLPEQRHFSGNVSRGNCYLKELNR